MDFRKLRTLLNSTVLQFAFSAEHLRQAKKKKAISPTSCYADLFLISYLWFSVQQLCFRLSILHQIMC